MAQRLKSTKANQIRVVMDDGEIREYDLMIRRLSSRDWVLSVRRVGEIYEFEPKNGKVAFRDVVKEIEKNGSSCK